MNPVLKKVRMLDKAVERNFKGRFSFPPEVDEFFKWLRTQTTGA
jgi:hypothetical protein